MTALLLASFDAATPYRAAIKRLRADDRAIVGLWSPMPVEGVETGGDRPIVPIMVAAGLCGAALFYMLIWWSAAVAYPFDSGGRPLNSWPTFLIAPIELGALIAGFAGVIAFLVRARLGRLNDPAFDFDEVGAAMADRFVVAVRCDVGDDANALIAMVGDAGAVHSHLIAS